MANLSLPADRRSLQSFCGQQQCMQKHSACSNIMNTKRECARFTQKHNMQIKSPRKGSTEMCKMLVLHDAKEHMDLKKWSESRQIMLINVPLISTHHCVHRVNPVLCCSETVLNLVWDHFLSVAADHVTHQFIYKVKMMFFSSEQSVLPRVLACSEP